jgi:hypothetical protein
MYRHVFCKKQVFITTYSNKICYTTTSHVSTKAVKDYWPYLLQVIQMYEARGFRIVMIRGDFEFNGITAQVASLPGAPHLSLEAGTHTEPVERNIRFIKEKARSLVASLPYHQRLPTIIIIWLVLHASSAVNNFPRSGGIPNYSPRMLLRDSQLSMDEFRVPFGTYVQVKESSTQTNSMLPRTRGAIALGSSGNTMGGHVFMALDTGAVIRRSQWTVIPVTDEVRARVELLGANEPRLLTWYNRHGDVIGDGPAWDAGHTTALADRNTQSVSREQDDATVREEQDVENQEWDPDEPDLDVVDDITGVDPHTEDVVEHLGVDRDGDVIEQVIEDGPVGTMTSGPTTNNDTVGMAVEGPSATGRPQRVRNPPKSFVPSMQGKKYSYAMAAIMENLYGKTANEAMRFMGNELREAGEHHRPEVIAVCMIQLSLKAAEAKFGAVRTKKAALAKVKQIHMRNTFDPKHWSELTRQTERRSPGSFYVRGTKEEW